MLKDKNISGEVLGEGDPMLLMQALMGEMRRMFRVEMEQVHERINRFKNSRVE